MAVSHRTSLRQAYIYGNTASAELPRRHQEGQERQRRHRKSHKSSPTVKRNQQNALRLDLPYVVVLTAAVACVLIILVNYLHVQSAISSRIHSIESLELELERLKAENDELETRINSSIDLDRIYRVATEELGMVYANREQVLLYDKTESEYVRQYEDITKH